MEAPLNKDVDSTKDRTDKSLKSFLERSIELLKSPREDNRREFTEQNREVTLLTDVICYGDKDESTYILEELLKLVEQAPKNMDEDSDSDTLTRLGAIKIMTNSYKSDRFQNDPILRRNVAGTIVRRRQKLSKETYYLATSAEELLYKRREVLAIAKLFKTIVYKEKDLEILEGIFACLMEGTGMNDFSLSSRENDLIQKMIKNAGEERKENLLQKYIDITLQREESFNYKDEFDYNAQYNLTGVYSSIFAVYDYLTLEQRENINNTVLKKIVETVQQHPDDGIRKEYLWPLRTIIDLEVERSEEFFEQQMEAEATILRTLIDITKEPLPDGIETRYSTLYNAYLALSEMLEQYIKGVTYQNESYLKIQENYREEYGEAFKAFTKNLPDDPDLRELSLRFFDETLSFDLLSHSTHPFLLSASNFIRKYYKNRLDSAIEQSE